MLFKNWADDLLAFQGSNRPSEEVLLKTQEALVSSKRYLTDLIAQRRLNPGEDLLSLLVLAESDGEKLTHDELLNTCITLLAAGQETTTALIGNMLLLLLKDPKLLLQIREDPSLIPGAIEEIVRFESPIPRQPRLIRRDIIIDGVELKAGQIAFQMLNSANRDSEFFDEPDSINFKRQSNKHLGFGLGAHYCVGAPLSRIEATIVLESLIERFSDIKLLSKEIKWNTVKRNSRVLESLNIAIS
jgi:cytochrome P450